MATGLARGAAKRGKKIAFGDGRKIIWDKNSEPVFRNNSNVARLGKGRSNIEWIRLLWRPSHLQPPRRGSLGMEL
jgi:hypothetical protein